MFFLFLLIILLFIGVAIYTSRFGVEIKNLEIDTERPKGERLNKESKVYVYLIIFGKFKIFKNNLIDLIIGMKNLKNKDFNISFLKNKALKIDYRDLIQKIDIHFEEIDLNVKIGTEDAAITAILSGIILAILGIILKKPKYEVVPVFLNKNFLNVKLDCIFSVQLMQYIYKLISNKMKSLIKERFNKKVEV